jgi:hypothetical protein
MAEKHKSKYKAPKDLEKSQKPKARKDLKDYTEDDKKGGLNPKSTGEKQLNVLRKTDKEVVDTGDLFVKYNADDRLYKDLEDGEYDPKHAAKVLKKRQDKDEKDNEKNIKDKIENLTREQRERLKERLVKEYIRRKVERILTEAEAETPEAPAEETPTPEAPAPAPTETPTPAAPEAPIDPAASEPAAPTDASTEPPAPDAPEAPASTATAETPESQSVTARVDYNAAGSQIAGEKNTIFRVEAMGNIINGALNALKEPKQKESFLRMLRSQVIKKYKQLDQESKSEE